MERSRKRYRPRISVAPEDIFTKQELHDSLVLARDRVVYSFIVASFFSRGKKRMTDNWIGGLGNRQKHLANHVMEVCNYRNKHFVRVAKVKEFLGKDLPTRLAREIADGIEQELLLSVIEEMCSSRPPAREIWYDEDGLWCILQSSVDQNRAARNALKKRRRQYKHDQRPFHGRVREQANRKGGCASSVGNHRYA